MAQNTRLNIILSADNREATKTLEATQQQVERFSEVVERSNKSIIESNDELYEKYIVLREGIEATFDLFRGSEVEALKGLKSTSKFLDNIAVKTTHLKSWNDLIDTMDDGKGTLEELTEEYKKLEKIKISTEKINAESFKLGKIQRAHQAETLKEQVENLSKVEKKMNLLKETFPDKEQFSILNEMGEAVQRLGKSLPDSLRLVGDEVVYVGDKLKVLGENWQGIANSVVGFANKFVQTLEGAEIFGRLTFGVLSFIDAMKEVPGQISEVIDQTKDVVSIFEQNPFIKAAAEIEHYEIRLKSLLGTSHDAHEALKFMYAEAGKGGFDASSMIEAGTVLSEFQLNIKETLPLVEKLAAGSGKELPQAAIALGNAFSGINGGFTQLQRSFRMTKDQLIQVGAATDNYNDIVNDTTEDVIKNQKAIEKLINTKYSNVVAEQAKTIEGSFSNFHLSIERLEERMGEVFKKPVTEVVNRMTGLVQKATSIIVPLMEWMQEKGVDFFSPVTFSAKIATQALDEIADKVVYLKDSFDGLSEGAKPVFEFLGVFATAAAGFTAALGPMIIMTVKIYAFYKATALLGTAFQILGTNIPVVGWAIKGLGSLMAITASSSASLTASLLGMAATSVVFSAGLVAVASAFGTLHKAQEEARVADEKYKKSIEENIKAGKRYHEFLGGTAKQYYFATEQGKNYKDAIKAVKKSYDDSLASIEKRKEALLSEQATVIDFSDSLVKSANVHNDVSSEMEKLDQEIHDSQVKRMKEVSRLAEESRKQALAFASQQISNAKMLELSGMSADQAQAGLKALREETEKAKIEYEELNATLKENLRINNSRSEIPFVASDIAPTTQLKEQVESSRIHYEELKKLNESKAHDLRVYYEKVSKIEEEAGERGEKLIENSMKIEKDYQKFERDLSSGLIENKVKESDKINDIYAESSSKRIALEKALSLTIEELDKGVEGEEREKLEKRKNLLESLFQALSGIEKEMASRLTQINVEAMNERLEKRQELLDHEIEMGTKGAGDQIKILEEWVSSEKAILEKRLGERVKLKEKEKQLEEDIQYQINRGVANPNRSALNALKIRIDALDAFEKASKSSFERTYRNIEELNKKNIQNTRKAQIEANTSARIESESIIENLHKENELGKFRVEYLNQERELTRKGFDERRKQQTELFEMEQANTGDEKIRNANAKKFANEMNGLLQEEINALEQVEKYYQGIKEAAKQAEVQQIESAKSVLASKLSALEDRKDKGEDVSKEIKENLKAQREKSDNTLEINKKLQLEKVNSEVDTTLKLKKMAADLAISEIEINKKASLEELKNVRETEASKLEVKIHSAKIANQFLKDAGLEPIGDIVEAEKAAIAEKTALAEEYASKVKQLEKSSVEEIAKIREELNTHTINIEEARAKKVKEIGILAENEIAIERESRRLEDERREIEHASRIARIRVQKDQEALNQIEVNRIKYEEDIRAGRRESINAFAEEAGFAEQIFESQKKILEDTLAEAKTHKDIEESRRAQVEYVQGMAKLEAEYAKQKRIDLAVENSARTEMSSRILQEAREAFEFEVESGRLSATSLQTRQKETQILLDQLAKQKELILAKAEEAIAQSNGVDKERIQKDARMEINKAVRETTRLIHEANQKQKDGNSDLDKAVAKYNKIKAALEEIRGKKEKDDEDLQAKEEDNVIGGFSELLREARLKEKLKRAEKEIQDKTKKSYDEAKLKIDTDSKNNQVDKAGKSGSTAELSKGSKDKGGVGGGSSTNPVVTQSGRPGSPSGPISGSEAIGYLSQIAAGISTLVGIMGRGGGAQSAKAPVKNSGQGPAAGPKNYNKNGKANEDDEMSLLHFNRPMDGVITFGSFSQT